MRSTIGATHYPPGLVPDEYKPWPLAQMEQSGQQEVLNWLCLAGAMSELNYKADIVDWVETWMFNAPKCMAVFKAA